MKKGLRVALTIFSAIAGGAPAAIAVNAACDNSETQKNMLTVSEYQLKAAKASYYEELHTPRKE